MSGVWHALTLVGIGAAAGAVIVNAFYLLRLTLAVDPARVVAGSWVWRAAQPTARGAAGRAFVVPRAS